MAWPTYMNIGIVPWRDKWGDIWLEAVWPGGSIDVYVDDLEYGIDLATILARATAHHQATHREEITEHENID